MSLWWTWENGGALIASPLRTSLAASCIMRAILDISDSPSSTPVHVCARGLSTGTGTLLTLRVLAMLLRPYPRWWLPRGRTCLVQSGWQRLQQRRATRHAWSLGPRQHGCAGEPWSECSRVSDQAKAPVVGKPHCLTIGRLNHWIGCHDVALCP